MRPLTCHASPSYSSHTWVYTPPPRWFIGRLVWVGDPRASVVRTEPGRAHVEYGDGACTWIHLG